MEIYGFIFRPHSSQKFIGGTANNAGTAGQLVN
jgi:hypothetical protein